MKISAEIILALIHIFGTYITYRMIKIFNDGQEKNRVIEIVSFVIFYFVNYYMIMKIKIPILMLIMATGTFFLLSFNYYSAISIKIRASLYTMLIIFISEVVVVLIAGGDTTATVEVSNDNLPLFISNTIIQYVTITFISNSKSSWRFKSMGYSKWYITLIISIFFMYANIIFQTGNLAFRKIMLPLLVSLYILSSLIFLYIKQQKERKNIMQERDNYVRQYELLHHASHTLVEVQNNMKNHVTVLKELADGNEKLLSYLNNISQDIVHMEKFIETGNQITDSIINTKISEAKSKGIAVKHEILIPMNLEVDYTMTTILGTLFDAAIEELEKAKDKNLYFFMKYDRGHILIWLIHSDEVPAEIRQKNKYIYRDTFKMRSVKKAVEKHQGSLQIEINHNRVEAFVQIYVCT